MSENSDYPEFKDKKVVITGAASGIGLATVKLFVQHGAKVFGIDKKLGDYAGCNFFKGDVRDGKVIQQIAEQIGSISILVNNAGIYLQSPITETSDELVDEIIDTNLKGPAILSRAFLPLMTKGSSMVNVCSGLSIAPEPVSPLYCASKAGLLMLTKSLALYYAREGIRINAVLPGPIDTPMLRNSLEPDELTLYSNLNPMGKIGSPHDVAEAIVFLASNKASFINGAAIAVDGGESTSSIYMYGGNYPSKP